jgi:nicotinamidase/pyrazinamidase
MTIQLKKDDALLIVDAQNDFFPGGALPVAQGDEIIPVINAWIEAAVAADIAIFASRDWHPANHCSFKAQGGPWPVHCVQNSTGAQIHHDIKLPATTVIINTADDPLKEGYSAFSGKTEEGVPLANALKSLGINRIWVNGLALDYCVCETALEGRANGFEVHLITSGTRAITSETGEEAMARMRAAGVIFDA